MSIHVVLFENEPHVARMISCRLMRANLEVHTVHDGESAWEVIERLQPQLLVTDVQLPALELVCRVRSTPMTAQLPIIALSAMDCDPVELDMLQREWNFTAILQKPFSPRRLVSLALEATHAESALSHAAM